ncbi:MAG: TrkH family potassium uptake protein, partial [Pseudomonadota bacterium]
MRRIVDLPLIIILMGIVSLMMFVPAGFAATTRDWLPARSFFYSGVLFALLTVLLGLATAGRRKVSLTRAYLTALVATFAFLPLMMAVPFNEAVPDTRFLNAYFEMVSSITTTGATLFEPDRLAPSVHLWRALAGWFGGYVMWVAAIAILAPLNLGGFEVISRGAVRDSGGLQRASSRVGRTTDSREILGRHALQLLPVYAGLTLALWFGLLVSGEAPLLAICHAMSTLATSGISPVSGAGGGQSGLAGEVLIFAFLVFGVSRTAFAPERGGWPLLRLPSDPEAQIGVLLVALIPSFLFLRHWIGAFEVAEEGDLTAAIGAFWGSAFTVLSFLTTTGFESGQWDTARDWSGLQTPGMILIGLALIGGGILLLRQTAILKPNRMKSHVIRAVMGVTGMFFTYGAV